MRIIGYILLLQTESIYKHETWVSQRLYTFKAWVTERLATTYTQKRICVRN